VSAFLALFGLLGGGTAIAAFMSPPFLVWLIRNASWLAPTVGIVAVIAVCWSYVGGLKGQIHTAQSQRNAAALADFRALNDVITWRTNYGTLDAALTRQSASLMAAGHAALATQRATEESDRRASQAAVATDRTIAQLRAEAAAARARGEELCAAALRIGRGG
jgi:hypothetical protein